MENKKNLKALLEERKKKKLQKKNKKDTSSAAQEEEDTQPDEAAAKPDQTIEEEADSKPAKKNRDNNDDSSDDELKYKIEVKHEIVEQQENSSQKQDVVEVPDYMKQKDDKDDASKEAAKLKAKRADGSNIKFSSGKPTFMNRQKAAGILGDDFQGLDDIDDQGKQKKNQRKAAEGGKEFVHMGSTAVDKNRKQEEEKSMDFKAATGRRPTFTGKAKIGGGASTEQTGPNIQYDFGVKYKSNAPDDAKKGQQEGKKAEGGEGQTEVRKDKRKINQEKTRFGAKDVALDDQDLDDGFEIVKDPNQKRRQQRANRTREDDDFSRKAEGERKDAAIKRGGAFGNLGGNESD